MKYLNQYDIHKYKLILEKSVNVGDNLLRKLNKINQPLAKKIKAFLGSEDIKDTANISKIDYDKDDNNLPNSFLKNSI